MRQDFFQYRPAFKLVIAGNHKPSLRSVDEAIRRRFRLIPFAVTIPPGERDADLAEKLKPEWPGILAWLVKGCLNWQTQGLRPPKAVLEATEAYLSAEDSIAAWLEEKCELNPSDWAALAHLFTSWSTWADAAGEAAGTMRKLGQALEARGFSTSRKRPDGVGRKGNPVRGVDGLRLIPEPSPWDER